jgi:hypothetical protein
MAMAPPVRSSEVIQEKVSALLTGREVTTLTDGKLVTSIAAGWILFHSLTPTAVWWPRRVT